MATAQDHLRRILSRATEILADEVLNCASLTQLYPNMGEIHPIGSREGHVQSLLFAGLRSSGYFTLAEANYDVPTSNHRQIDLAVWLPDLATWLYLEIEPCSPHLGYLPVLADAGKLINDSPRATRDQLRALLVYGFRWDVERDSFPQKYEAMSKELAGLGFMEVSICRRSVEMDGYKYVQAGMWVVGQGTSTS